MDITQANYEDIKCELIITMTYSAFINDSMHTRTHNYSVVGGYNVIPYGWKILRVENFVQFKILRNFRG